MYSYEVFPRLADRTIFINGSASGIEENLVDAHSHRESRVVLIDLDSESA